MFAARYFAPRYWAPRYWAKVGAVAVAVDRNVFTGASQDNVFTGATQDNQFAATKRGSVEGGIE